MMMTGSAVSIFLPADTSHGTRLRANTHTHTLLTHSLLTSATFSTCTALPSFLFERNRLARTFSARHLQNELQKKQTEQTKSQHCAIAGNKYSLRQYLFCVQFTLTVISGNSNKKDQKTPSVCWGREGELLTDLNDEEKKKVKHFLPNVH